MGEQQHLQTENDEIFKIFTDAIKIAAEMTHCYNTFQSKTKGLMKFYAWIIKKSSGKLYKNIFRNTVRLSITLLLLQEFTFIRSVLNSTML